VSVRPTPGCHMGTWEIIVLALAVVAGAEHAREQLEERR
jgi:hypothetical protein